jgi:hypothetical protein
MNFCEFAGRECDRISELGGGFKKDRGVFHGSVVLCTPSVNFMNSRFGNCLTDDSHERNHHVSRL